MTSSFNPEIRFNPTATAMQYTGRNHKQISELLDRHNIAKDFDLDAMNIGDYIVVFLGDVYYMNEAQFKSAQGLV